MEAARAAAVARSMDPVLYQSVAAATAKPAAVSSKHAARPAIPAFTISATVLSTEAVSASVLAAEAMAKAMLMTPSLVVPPVTDDMHMTGGADSAADARALLSSQLRQMHELTEQLREEQQIQQQLQEQQQQQQQTAAAATAATTTAAATTATAAVYRRYRHISATSYSRHPRSSSSSSLSRAWRRCSAFVVPHKPQH